MRLVDSHERKSLPLICETVEIFLRIGYPGLNHVITEKLGYLSLRRGYLACDLEKVVLRDSKD
jgi:hypothetical protein